MAGLLDRAVAVDAVDLDRRPRLAVELAVAVVVLLEVAVHAVHPLLEVDVLQVDGLLELLRVVGGAPACPAASSRLPFRSCLKTARKTQPWPWKSANCVFLSLRVQGGDVGQEVAVGPQAAQGRRPRGWRAAISSRSAAESFFGSFGYIDLAVGLVVPPGVAEVGGDHVGAGVHVAGDALARRDRAGEGVLQRVARLVLRDGRVGGLGRSRGCPPRRRRPEFDRRAVVGVDDVAGAAAARAVVARVVVGAQERQQRDRARRVFWAPRTTGSVRFRVPGPRGREPLVGLARLLEGIGQADLELAPSAALEDAEGVAGLAQLPAREGHEERQHALLRASPRASAAGTVLSMRGLPSGP